MEIKNENNRRSFIKKVTIGGIATAFMPATILSAKNNKVEEDKEGIANSPQLINSHAFNGVYSGDSLKRLAFPVGGIGAGMFCMEGSGAFSHMSIRNKPEIFNEPAIFAAINIRGIENNAKVLEGPVPDWKIFGQRGSGNGDAGSTYGLPRFNRVEFRTKFPFGTVHLQEDDFPLEAQITAWSPFIPTDADNSSLPVGALEYTFKNTSSKKLEAVFSFNSKNFLASEREVKNSIVPTDGGFVLHQDGSKEKPHLQSDFSVFTDQPSTVVDHCWFRGGWWDPLTMAWNDIKEGKVISRPAVDKDAPGASLFVPFWIAPGAVKTIRVMVTWYTPVSDLKIGEVVEGEKKKCDFKEGCCIENAGSKGEQQESAPRAHYLPWYSSKFKNIQEVNSFWKRDYADLRRKTSLFSDAFYKTTLPAEVIEAVAANLTIIKSPTVLRQYDGRLWSWEGCGDDAGCCAGSCTHVWNYAQALPHLFPDLERSLRNTEFCENQNLEGHQTFRANLPISPLKHDFYAASDGQLGGIMKVHRDWRISGDSEWLAKIYPMVKVSMDYCIKTWDPRSRGVVEEPHHNTYDIEFWGPDGMCTSFYLGALTSMIQMGDFLKKDTGKYKALYEKGKTYLETKLFDGEYFVQHIEYQGLNAPDPAKAKSFGGDYSPEATSLLKKEGPKYQYGTGCLSDGILGAWIGRMCAIPDFIDAEKVASHLVSVHKYNLKKDLSQHANPQRPSYAVGKEGGLLLCTWPKGGKLSLPFVYSDEVWTGIEYQVASHLILMGKVREGLEIVRYCRQRYNGVIRNPFNEYECGHWYARAMSSYGLLESLTGVRYDAVDKTLFIDSRVGDFTSFLSTATGFGSVSLKAGKPDLEVVYGKIDVDSVIVNGKKLTV